MVGGGGQGRAAKYEGNGPSSLCEWHRCHHLVLISFHLLAPPLRQYVGIELPEAHLFIISMGTQGRRLREALYEFT